MASMQHRPGGQYLNFMVRSGRNIGGVPVGSGPAELERLAAGESARWGEIVRRLGIRAD